MKLFKSPYIKFALSLVLSGLILYLLYRKLSFNAVLDLISTINPYYFTGFILLILVQLFMASYRWQRILLNLAGKDVSLFKSSQYVIGSYSANLIIPAKMGEFVRVAWEKDKERRKYVLRLVVLEKLLDVFSLYAIYSVSLSFAIKNSERFWLFVFTVLLPVFLLVLVILLIRVEFIRKRIPQKINELSSLLKALFNEKKAFFFRLILFSIALWLVQVGQFILIFLSTDLHPGLMEAYAGNSLAVLAGAFIPSIGGIGPRDATIVWFFEGLTSNLLLTTIGLLSALRIIIPALIGLPFFFNLTRKS